MPATIRDVAERSGVSISTASRALNNRADVSKTVRERVLAAARELSYVVNSHARALKATSSQTLGVILYDSALTFSALMMRGVHDVVSSRGYSLVVCDTDGKAEAELHAHQALIEKRVDGVLINSLQSGAEPLRRLLVQNVPFVLLNRRSDDLDCDYAIVDFLRGSYLAANHLLANGHRRILYQLFSPHHPASHERALGYRQALEEHGLPFDPALLVYSDDRYEGCYQSILQAMTQLQPRPTAVMAYNDEAALPILKAISDLSLRIPDDVAVVGQNDLNFARFLVPPLTSVAQPIYEMGRQGAETLLQKIAWPPDEVWTPRHLIQEPKLIIRASSGTP